MITTSGLCLSLIAMMNIRRHYKPHSNQAIKGPKADIYLGSCKGVQLQMLEWVAKDTTGHLGNNWSTWAEIINTPDISKSRTIVPKSSSLKFMLRWWQISLSGSDRASVSALPRTPLVPEHLQLQLAFAFSLSLSVSRIKNGGNNYFRQAPPVSAYNPYLFLSSGTVRGGGFLGFDTSFPHPTLARRSRLDTFIAQIVLIPDMGGIRQ